MANAIMCLWLGSVSLGKPLSRKSCGFKTLNPKKPFFGLWGGAESRVLKVFRAPGGGTGRRGRGMKPGV